MMKGVKKEIRKENTFGLSRNENGIQKTLEHIGNSSILKKIKTVQINDLMQLENLEKLKLNVVDNKK